MLNSDNNNLIGNGNRCPRALVNDTKKEII